jgi:hypothetical protein
MLSSSDATRRPQRSIKLRRRLWCRKPASYPIGAAHFGYSEKKDGYVDGRPYGLNPYALKKNHAIVHRGTFSKCG